MPKELPLSHYGVALQPICNSDFQHVADELLYRSKRDAKRADVDDPLLATARACTSAFYEVGLKALVGDRFLFFNATAEWVHNPDILPLPNDQLVAEVPPHLLSEPEIVEQLKGVRNRGFMICLDDRALEKYPDISLDRIDFLKVDCRRSDAFSWPGKLKNSGLTLVGTFLESRKQLDAAKQAGFKLFQGYVFAPPSFVQSPNKRRAGNPAIEMMLIADLALKELEPEALEKLLIQHPHLCQLIFKQLNSSANSNLVRQITSLREAINYLGVKRLRALAVALSLSRNDPVQTIQLRKVMTRAALCRSIAARLRDVDENTAFTVGLLSLIGQVEGEPMSSLLSSTPFHPSIKKALLHGEGNLGKLLDLIERYEQGELKKISETGLRELNQHYLKAVAWTDSLLTPKHGKS